MPRDPAFYDADTEPLRVWDTRSDNPVENVCRDCLCEGAGGSDVYAASTRRIPSVFFPEAPLQTNDDGKRPRSNIDS